jgi:hypothetical protein
MSQLPFPLRFLTNGDGLLCLKNVKGEIHPPNMSDKEQFTLTQ